MQTSFETNPVNPFFTKAQLVAFSQPPRTEAIGYREIAKGKSEAFIHGDYIPILLNYFVGAGMWERTSTFNSDYSEVITKKRRNQAGQWEEYENLIVSVSVKTTLTIYPRDGSSRRLVFEANAIGTANGNPANGKTELMKNAIKTAETDGLKRAAKNLGAAFGLDIKHKITRAMMPPSIPEYQSELERRENARKAASDPSAETLVAAPAPVAQIAAPAPASAPAPVVEAPPAQVAPAPVREAPVENAIKHDPEPEVILSAHVEPVEQHYAEEHPQAIAPDRLDRAPVAQDNPASTHKAVAQPAPAAAATAPAEYNLGGVIPSTYEEWCSFITTLQARVNRCALEKEVDAFCERYKKRIACLPIIPASDKHPERDFKTAWANIVKAKKTQIHARSAANNPDQSAA